MRRKSPPTRNASGSGTKIENTSLPKKINNSEHSVPNMDVIHNVVYQAFFTLDFSPAA